MAKRDTKRGRPPVFDPAIIEFFDGHTRRSAQNQIFAGVALNALEADEPGAAEAFPWLFGYGGLKHPMKKRLTVLAELGRFRDPGLIVFLARELEKDRNLTAAEAVRILRWFRLNRLGRGVR